MRGVAGDPARLLPVRAPALTAAAELHAPQRGDVAGVGPAAAADDLERRQVLLERPVRRARGRRGRPRRAPRPRPARRGSRSRRCCAGRGSARPTARRSSSAGQHVLRVGAVDQEVRRRRDRVDLLASAVAAGSVPSGQPAVGLDGEADADREPERARRPAPRRSPRRDRSGSARTRPAAPASANARDLGRVVLRRLVRVDALPGGVPVPARTDHPDDHDVGHPVAPARRPSPWRSSTAVAVGVGQRRARRAPSSGAPVGVRPPGRRLQPQPGADGRRRSSAYPS